MTPNEELDLARARDLCGEEFGDWHDMDDFTKGACLDMARAIRIGDEARGLRVVPVEATQHQVDAATARPRKIMEELMYYGIYRAMVAASPFAPEEKP